MLCSAVLCAVKFSMHCDVVWCDVVWCGVVWYVFCVCHGDYMARYCLFVVLVIVTVNPNHIYFPI